MCIFNPAEPQVLLNKLQKIRKMSAVKRSLLRHVPGDISCALGANGCDIATDWVEPQGCGATGVWVNIEVAIILLL